MTASGSQTTSQPVAGQTSPTLSLTNAQASQNQTYYCLVIGSCGNVWSNGFALTVQSATCASMYTLETGNWNDPTVWSCGRVPVSTDVVTLNHAVTMPVSYLGLALRVIYNTGGQLLFSSGGSLKWR